MTIYKDLKVSDLQTNACLAHLVRHWTASGRSPLEVNFFAVVKSFEYKIAISAYFVQSVKNSNARDKRAYPISWIQIKVLTT